MTVEFEPPRPGADGKPREQKLRLVHEGNSHDVKAPAIITVNMETLEMESIDWIWPGWLARGKLHLIAGAPEGGKTTIGLSISATISSGGYWPDGTRAPAGNVLIWTSEDGLKDTIKPRPWYSTGTRTGKSGRSILLSTCRCLQPVVDFAEAAGCAVFGVSHFTKGTAGKDPIERITGSLAFGALPRIVMAAAKTEGAAEGDMPRILVRAKSNIGPSGGGFGYDIEAAPLYDRPDITATRVVWLEPIDGTARELLGEAEDDKDAKADTKIEQAKQFLEAALAKGGRLKTEIEAEAEAVGIAEMTLRRAKKNIGVTAYRKVSGCGTWLWRLG